MKTAQETYWALGPPEKFEKFLTELKEYLKTKLQRCEVDGRYTYYSCGHEYHHSSDSSWKPFKNLEEFCCKKGLDHFSVINTLIEKSGIKYKCECQILNDIKSIRAYELQKIFGMDMESGECSLVCDDSWDDGVF